MFDYVIEDPFGNIKFAMNKILTKFCGDNDDENELIDALMIYRKYIRELLLHIRLLQRKSKSDGYTLQKDFDDSRTSEEIYFFWKWLLQKFRQLHTLSVGLLINIDALKPILDKGLNKLILDKLS